MDTLTPPPVDITTMPTELAKAWVKAWGELTDPVKDSTASIDTRSGGNFTYDYATLDRINDTIRPVLANHGLAPIGRYWSDGARQYCQTILVHESGEMFDSGILQFPQVADPKANGSNHTYSRRYQILALLALAPGVDDDGDQAWAGARRANSNRTVSSTTEPVVREPSAAQIEAIANAAQITTTAEMLRKVWNNAGAAGAMNVDVAPYVGSQEPITLRAYLLRRGEDIKKNTPDEPEQPKQEQQPDPEPEAPAYTRDQIDRMSKTALKKAYADQGQEWKEAHEKDIKEAREWLATVLGL